MTKEPKQTWCCGAVNSGTASLLDAPILQEGKWK